MKKGIIVETLDRKRVEIPFSSGQILVGFDSEGNPEAKQAETFLVKVDAPAAAGATGTKGSYANDGNYLYLCVATDAWVRAPLASW